MRGTTRRLVTTGVVALAFIGSQAVHAAAGEGAPRTPGDTWSLAEDFRLAPNQANPNPDSYGNPAVWLFGGLRQGTPILLRDFTSAAFGVPGLEQWQGPVPAGGEDDKLPAVGINSTGVEQRIGTLVWPAGAVRVHPLPGNAVVVGWRSPIDGAVQMDAQFLDIDPGGGNGASWKIQLDEFPLGQGYFSNGNGSGIGSMVFVSKGDVITFSVFPFQGDAANDSTRLDVTLTQVQL